MSNEHTGHTEQSERAEKIAPVQGYAAGIPWSLHLEAYDAYCKRWGPQHAMIDLEGRNCRGGFSVGELDGFIPGWRERASEIGRLRARVKLLEQENAALLAADKPAESGGEIKVLRSKLEDMTADYMRSRRELMEFKYAHPQPSALPDEVVKDANHPTDFVRDLVKAYTDEVRYFLDETYKFASQSPKGRDNINAAMQLLDDIDAAMLKEGK